MEPNPDHSPRQAQPPPAIEDTLRAVWDCAADAMALSDSEGIVILANPAYCTLYGLTQEQIVGRDFALIYPEAERARALARYRMAFDSVEIPPTFESTVQRADGSLRTVESRINFVSRDGRRAAMLSIIRDISAQRQVARRTHDALSALLAIAEALVQGAGDDQAGDLSSADPARGTALVAGRLLELTRTVLGCRRVSITAYDAENGASHPVAVAGLTPEEESAWRSERAGTGLRAYLDTAQQQRLAAEGSLTLDAASTPGRTLPYGVRTLLLALMRVGPQVVGVLALDYGEMAHTYAAEEIALARAVAKFGALVLERERLLQEREAARAQAAALREANRRMDAFLGIAGHEMRTPLTSMNGNIQLIRRRIDRLLDQSATDLEALLHGMNALRPLLERTDGGVRRLNRLVDDVLDVSRVQAGRLYLCLAPCDLAGVLRDVVDEHRQLYPTRSLAIEIPEQEVSVEADAARIGQVIVNYVSNALKYAPPDRPIIIGLDAQGTDARVWVRDSGPGLSVAEQERVWDRFYRVERVGHQSGSSIGLGLGLHISRMIVEQHHGTVGVESTLGDGATFWFTLPLLDAASPSAGNPAGGGEEPARDKEVDVP